MMIYRGEFKKCSKQLTKDPDLQKIETKNYVFLRVNNNVTVKFKNVKNLTGYFTMDEITNQKELTIILKTLEKELEKKEALYEK
jgi:hypothetical protein